MISALWSKYGRSREGKAGKIESYKAGEDLVKRQRASEGKLPLPTEFDFDAFGRPGPLSRFTRWVVTHPNTFAFLRRLFPIFRFQNVLYVWRHADVTAILNSSDDFRTPYDEEMKHLSGGTGFFLGMERNDDYFRQIGFIRRAMEGDVGALTAKPWIKNDPGKPSRAEALGERLRLNGDIENILKPWARAVGERLVNDSGGAIDAVKDLIIPGATEVCSTYYGLDLDDRDAFAEWSMAVSTLLFSDPFGDAKARSLAMAAADRMQVVIRNSIKRADRIVQKHPGACCGGGGTPDHIWLQRTLIGRLVCMKHAGEVGGVSPPTDDEICTIIIGMVGGFVPTITLAASYALEFLLGHPEAWRRTVAAARGEAITDGDKNQRQLDDTDLEKCLTEAMRFSPPINPGLFRIATKNTRFKGHRVRKGDTVHIATASAMMDPNEAGGTLQNPLTFDPDRPQSGELMFGGYLHWCIGERIAKVVMAQLLKPLLKQDGLLRERPGLRASTWRIGTLRSVGSFPRNLEMRFQPVCGHRSQNQVTIVAELSADITGEDRVPRIDRLNELAARLEVGTLHRILERTLKEEDIRKACVGEPTLSMNNLLELPRLATEPQKCLSKVFERLGPAGKRRLAGLIGSNAIRTVIEKLGNPAHSGEGSIGAALTQTKLVHFASLNAIDLRRRADAADTHDIPADRDYIDQRVSHLYFELNVDGPANHAIDIIARHAGHLLADVFTLGCGVKAPDSDTGHTELARFLKANIARFAHVSPFESRQLLFGGTPGHPVSEIAEEKEIEEEARQHLADFVTNNARHGAPATAALNYVRTRLHNLDDPEKSVRLLRARDFSIPAASGKDLTRDRALIDILWNIAKPALLDWRAYAVFAALVLGFAALHVFMFRWAELWILFAEPGVSRLIGSLFYGFISSLVVLPAAVCLFIWWYNREDMKHLEFWQPAFAGWRFSVWKLFGVICIATCALGIPIFLLRGLVFDSTQARWLDLVVPLVAATMLLLAPLIYRRSRFLFLVLVLFATAAVYHWYAPVAKFVTMLDWRLWTWSIGLTVIAGLFSVAWLFDDWRHLRPGFWAPIVRSSFVSYVTIAAVAVPSLILVGIVWIARFFTLENGLSLPAQLAQAIDQGILAAGCAFLLSLGWYAWRSRFFVTAAILSLIIFLPWWLSEWRPDESGSWLLQTVSAIVAGIDSWHPGNNWSEDGEKHFLRFSLSTAAVASALALALALIERSLTTFLGARFKGEPRRVWTRGNTPPWWNSHAVFGFVVRVGLFFGVLQLGLGLLPGTWTMSKFGALSADVFGSVLYGLLWAPIFILVATGTLLLGFRRMERADEIDERSAPPEWADRLAEREDAPNHKQNHVIAVAPLKPGRGTRMPLYATFLRRISLTLGLWGVKSLSEVLLRPGFVLDMGTIHFARLFRLKNSDKLVFTSNYDGSWESYLEDFITKAHVGQTALWSNCIGFPETSFLIFGGASDGDRFKRWVRRQQLPTQFWYSRFPELTTDRIRTNALIRDGLCRARTDSEARAWVDLFSSIPRPPEALETPEIQTLVFRALKNHPCSYAVALKFPEEEMTRVRRWIRWLALSKDESAALEDERIEIDKSELAELLQNKDRYANLFDDNADPDFIAFGKDGHAMEPSKKTLAQLGELSSSELQGLTIARKARPGRIAFGEWVPREQKSAVMLALSATGLRRLGLGNCGSRDHDGDALASFPASFRNGMAARAEQLGDDPSTWDWGNYSQSAGEIAAAGAEPQPENRGSSASEAIGDPTLRVDALLLIYAVDPEELEHAYRREKFEFEWARITEQKVISTRLVEKQWNGEVQDWQQASPDAPDPADPADGAAVGDTHAQPQLPASKRTYVEPFGFRDGISQPVIEGSRSFHDGVDDIHAVKPGEFVLGYRDTHGYFPSTPLVDPAYDPDCILPNLPQYLSDRFPEFSSNNADGARDFGRNGSFLVVRQLKQDVSGFREQTRSVAAEMLRAFRLAENPPATGEVGQPRGVNMDKATEWIAAKIMGRWRDGSSLVRFPNEPRNHMLFPEPDNAFLFGRDDPQGMRCPYGAHIRRANPRDSLGTDQESQLKISNRHRLLRVGRTWTDGDDVGLLFMCLNADLERQFEFVQQTWLGSRSFHGLRDESDPLGTGRNDDLSPYTIPTPLGPLLLPELRSFITMKGGEYFFLPSRSALHFLSHMRVENK